MSARVSFLKYSYNDISHRKFAKQLNSNADLGGNLQVASLEASPRAL